MKLDRDNITIIKSNTETTKLDFGIKDPAIIFDILCTKLYENPIKILVQEYMCNARDSHREHGNIKKSIEVVLPNDLSDVLKIRDFGVGISPDRMKDVFVYLGESTKNTSDDQTGGFGVGAKVAWAYTDSFTIRTRFNKIEYVYLAFIGDKGIGQLDLIKTKKTRRRNGTTIEVTIKKSDFQKVEKFVYRTSHFWEVRPIIKNNFYYDFPKNKDEEIAYTDVGTLLSNPPTYLASDDTNKINIVLDGIIYKNIRNYIDEQPSELSTGYGRAMYIHFKTNELKPSINRENIILNTKTIDILEKRYNDITEFIASDFQNGIDPKFTFTEMIEYVEGYDLSKFTVLKSYCFEFKGLWFYINNANRLYLKLDPHYCVNCYEYERRKDILRHKRIETKLYIDEVFSNRVFFNDKFTKTVNRKIIKKYCADNKNRQIFVIQPILDTTSIDTMKKSESKLIEFCNNTCLIASSFAKKPDYNRIMSSIKVRYIDNGTYRWGDFHDLHRQHDMIVDVGYRNPDQILRLCNKLFKYNNKRILIIRRTQTLYNKLDDGIISEIMQPSDFINYLYTLSIENFNDDIYKFITYHNLPDNIRNNTQYNKIRLHLKSIIDPKLKCLIKNYLDFANNSKRTTLLSNKDSILLDLYNTTRGNIIFNGKPSMDKRHLNILEFCKRKERNFNVARLKIHTKYPLLKALLNTNYVENFNDVVDYLNGIHITATQHSEV